MSLVANATIHSFLEPCTSSVQPIQITARPRSAIHIVQQSTGPAVQCTLGASGSSGSTFGAMSVPSGMFQPAMVAVTAQLEMFRSYPVIRYSLDCHCHCRDSPEHVQACQRLSSHILESITSTSIAALRTSGLCCWCARALKIPRQAVNLAR